jgi:nucleoside-diphosphate-sugar epimerase
MRILITGGKGFVGEHLASTLVHNHDVYIADVVPPKAEFYLTSKYLELDVTDSLKVDEIISTIQPELICHFAAKVSFKWSFDKPRKDLSLHALGTLNVLEAARMIKPHPHIVYAGSSAIFGNAGIIPTPEGCPPDPTSPYGITKLVGEKYCELYQNTYGVPISILRFTNIYGPGSDHGVVSAFIDRAMTGKPITIFGGSQQIQFVYISDVVQAYRKVIENRIKGTYNIGGPDVVTLKELAEIVLQETGVTIPVEIKPSVKGDIMKVIFDTTKAEISLSWKPLFSTREGIRKCIEYQYKLEEKRIAQISH